MSVTPRLTITTLAVALSVAVGALRIEPVLAQTDLDALMKSVVAKRDDNWKKLQQYILNEKESIELRGPGQFPIWGERRDYQWFLRDGFFVRSPLKVNGVSVPDDDRAKYEAEFTRRERARDRRIAEREKQRAAEQATAGEAAPATTPAAASEPVTADTLIAQTREPRFISSAYFLKFKFEEGKYALVGRDTIDGRSVLKVEYYPTRLFSDDTERNAQRIERGQRLSKDQQMDQGIETAMNKVSLVTLWVEPHAQQIVKYTFDNVNLDFLPLAQLFRLGDLRATMEMTQPLVHAQDAAKDVWLPKGIEMYAAVMIAVGQFDLRAKIDYTDYKLAQTSSRIK